MTETLFESQTFTPAQIKAIDRYLNISIPDAQPDLSQLNQLIAHYASTVPFENISVQNKVAIDVKLESLFHKIIESRRGGYCYEMNTFFKHYLLYKGYDAYNVSATIRTPDGWSREGSHMSLLVQLDRLYVADVGFGDLPLQALPITPEDEAVVIHDVNGQYRAVERDNGFVVQKMKEGEFQTLYRAEFAPRDLSYFDDNLYYNQHNPDSIFVKKLIITLPLSDGRVTMSERNLTITKQDEKEVQAVTKDNYRQFLNDYFGMDVAINKWE